MAPATILVVDDEPSASNGDLSLYGDVDLWSQREHAENAARTIQGVRRVTNLIQVRAGTPTARSTAGVKNVVDQLMVEPYVT
jgi:osmotically-inducible protein OsmY